MSVRIKFDCPSRTQSDTQDLVDGLMRDLNELHGIEAAAATTPAPRGSKGDVITLGEIVMALISSGAVVAAIGVFKSYFDREPTLEATIEGPDGETVKLNIKNVKSEQMSKAIKLLEKSVHKKR